MQTKSALPFLNFFLPNYLASPSHHTPKWSNSKHCHQSRMPSDSTE